MFKFWLRKFRAQCLGLVFPASVLVWALRAQRYSLLVGSREWSSGSHPAHTYIYI